MSNGSALGVIPARYASTRLPGKPLAMIAGKPMIQHVYERACRAKTLDKVIVATDDERIFEAVCVFGGNVQMTRRDHPSGSDRVAEIAAQTQFELVANIQGDEPFLAPKAIDMAVEKLIATPDAVVSTLVTRFADFQSIQSSNTAKVVLNDKHEALYFSRASIPFHRDIKEETKLPWRENFFQHIGLYIFRRDFLQQFVKLPVCDLEQIEKLEQLRILKCGYKITCAFVDYHSFCVDTPEDLQKAQILAEENSFGNRQ